MLGIHSFGKLWIAKRSGSGSPAMCSCANQGENVHSFGW